MTRLTKDQIGNLGELLAAATLSRPVGGRFNRPIFRPTNLGGKYPTVDLLVDLLGPDDVCNGFLLVQVKATYSKAATVRNRLPISVSVEKFNQLVRLPLPTYLIGVDVRTEASYLVAAQQTRTKPVSSVTKAFDLSDEAVKIDLYKEVQAFWDAAQRILHYSRFSHD